MGLNTRSPVLADCLTSPSTSQERSKFGLQRRVIGDQPRANWRRSLKCLALEPLRTTVLPVAATDIVDHGVPRNGLSRR